MKDLALDGRLFLDDELDCALQEIDILLSTSNTELIGYPDFGTDFESFLWTLSPSTYEIESYIKEKIEKNTYYAKNFDPVISVQYLEGNYRSIYYVKIILNDSRNGVTGVREYQFQ